MKKKFLYVQAAFYMLAGINHFWHPSPYRSIMPRWLPWPDLLISFTGVLEIVFGALLMWPHSRKFAAWSIIALLIAIYPANIQMAMDCISKHDARMPIAIARLPLQLVLIWWAWLNTRK